MLRTIVSFESEEKFWLDQEAKAEHVPMAEVVRNAVRYYRQAVEAKKQPDILRLLDKTAGLWKQGDGLNYQRKLRAEWEK